jgi:hypothetical protein
MKSIRIAIAIMFTALATPALAQWQVPNGATPYGRGGGALGFNSAGPCAAGQTIVGNPPACGPVDIVTGTSGNLPPGRIGGPINIDTGTTGKLPGNRLSSSVRVVTAAGSVTVTTADYLVIINKTVPAATIVGLPATPTAGDTYIVKDGRGDAWLNNITVTPSAGTIDGLPSYVIGIGYGGVTFVYNGTQWNVL